MPKYTVRFELEDAYARKSSKTFETIPGMVSEAAALTAAALLADEIADLTEMEILGYSVSQRIVYADSVDAGANKDEGLTLVLRKEDNTNDVIKLPGPVNSVFNPDGTVDLTDALIIAFVANFITAGDWTFSDGEQASELKSGRLDK